MLMVYPVWVICGNSLLSLPNNVWRLIVFALFLIIIIIIIILLLFLAHELVHGRSQELLDRIS
jgi:fatty acid desaturase